MMYITFTYTPLARTQSYDETVNMCIQKEKERNLVQNQPVSATSQVCVCVCVSMQLCVPVIYLECNELKQQFISFLSWSYGLTGFTLQGSICFDSLLHLKSDVGQGCGPLKIRLDWVSSMAPQMACSSCWPSPGGSPRNVDQSANTCPLQMAQDSHNVAAGFQETVPQVRAFQGTKAETEKPLRTQLWKSHSTTSIMDPFSKTSHRASSDSKEGNHIRL